jgi:hypothetical protein
VAVARVEQHAGHGAGALVLVQDPYFEVDELYVLQVGVALADRRAQRLVERVEGPVAPCVADVALAVHPDPDRGVRLHVAVLVLLGDHPPRLELEQRLILARLLADQQVERPVGCLQVVAAVLQLLDPVDHPCGGGIVHVAARLDGPLARQLRHEHLAVGAHEPRVDVLERARVAADAGHVHAALVSEGVGADVGLVRVRGDVAELVDEVRDLGQAGELLGIDAVVAELELEAGHDRDQVGVAAAFAVPVHRPLHQPGAALDGQQRVGHSAAGVVMRVDPDLHGLAELAHRALGGGRHLGGQRRAVGVAEGDVLGAGLHRGAEAAQGVVGIVPEGVEEVLGVVDHPLVLANEEADGVGDHPQVVLGIDVGDLLEVKRPRLADQRADGREAIGQQAQGRVVGGGRVPATGHPEGRELRVLETLAREQIEQSLLLGVRGGEAGLDHLDPERVEGVGHAHLLVHGQRHALPLHAVAEGGVVEEYLFSQWERLCGSRERTSEEGRPSGRLGNSLERGSAHAFDGTGTTSSHFA